MGFVAYNVIMGLQLAAVLYTQRHSRRRAPLRSTLGFVMACLGLGALLGLGLYPATYVDNAFAMMKMWAFGLFIHVPLLLLGQAWLHRRRRGWVVFFGLAAALALAVAVDAFVLEPTALQVRSFVVRSGKLDRRYRVAVVADLQTDAPGPYERRVLTRVLAERPDLIVMPGDYVQGDDHAHHAAAQRALNALLRQLDFGAPLGAFAVQGNVDLGDDWTTIFDGTRVMPYGKTSTVTVGGLTLTPLSFDDSFRTDLIVPAQPGFHIVFGHGPDFALGDVDADLLLAGHTHGGQVQLPWIGPLITFSRIPRAWADGATALPDGRVLVVSRGIGMERKYAPRLRFFCRPEIVIVDLVPS